MKKVRWEEMFPDEFEKALSEFPACYMPLGTLERHGAHLTFGLDSLKAHSICVRTAEKFGGIVLPPLYWGTHGYWAEDFKRGGSVEKGTKQPPGSVYISEGLFFNLLMEMFREIDHSGFKLTAAYTGHYPQQQTQLLKRAAGQYMEESKMHIWTFSEPELSGEVEVGGDHAGKWETSYMMALFPDMADISKAPSPDAQEFTYSSRTLHEASRETGETAVDYLVENIGKYCENYIACGQGRNERA